MQTSNLLVWLHGGIFTFSPRLELAKALPRRASPTEISSLWVCCIPFSGPKL